MGTDASQTALAGEIGSSFFTLPGTGVLAFLRRSQPLRMTPPIDCREGGEFVSPLLRRRSLIFCATSRSRRSARLHTLRDGNGQRSLLPK